MASKNKLTTKTEVHNEKFKYEKEIWSNEKQGENTRDRTKNRERTSKTIIRGEEKSVMEI